jgi:hypothetical protein
MNENELRIGNYVNLIAEGHEKEPDTFKWDLEDYEFYYDRMDFIKPIPLKEEWLIKFGFKKLRDRERFELEKFTIDLYSEFFPKGRVYYNSWAIIEKKIDYVHELQNLYFCLTNKELELCDI